jgi:hypothetical protein
MSLQGNLERDRSPRSSISLGAFRDGAILFGQLIINPPRNAPGGRAHPIQRTPAPHCSPLPPQRRLNRSFTISTYRWRDENRPPLPMWEDRP